MLRRLLPCYSQDISIAKQIVALIWQKILSTGEEQWLFLVQALLSMFLIVLGDGYNILNEIMINNIV